MRLDRQKQIPLFCMSDLDTETVPIDGFSVSGNYACEFKNNINDVVHSDLISAMVLRPNHENSPHPSEVIVVCGRGRWREGGESVVVRLSVKWSGKIGVVQFDGKVICFPRDIFAGDGESMNGLSVYAEGIYTELPDRMNLSAGLHHVKFPELTRITSIESPTSFNVLEWNAASNISSVRLIYGSVTRLHLTKIGLAIYKALHPENPNQYLLGPTPIGLDHIQKNMGNVQLETVINLTP